MPAKKSVKPPIAVGSCIVHTAAACSSGVSSPAIFACSGVARGEQRREPPAERDARSSAQRHQRVEGRPRGSLGRLRGLPAEHPGGERRRQVENHLADRHPATRCAAGWAEDPKRQVLDREFAVSAGRSDPALAPDIVSFVDGAHRGFVLVGIAARSSRFRPTKARRKSRVWTSAAPRLTACAQGASAACMWRDGLRFIDAIWHVVGLLLVALLVNEAGVDGWRRLSRRLRYRRATRPAPCRPRRCPWRGADWSVAYFDEFHRAVRVDWKPYVEWWQRPFRGAYVTLDERGLRPTPGETDADADALRILCFGGSTMMGMGARDDHTIPALLARRLAGARPSRRRHQLRSARAQRHPGNHHSLAAAEGRDAHRHRGLLRWRQRDGLRRANRGGRRPVQRSAAPGRVQPAASGATARSRLPRR